MDQPSDDPHEWLAALQAGRDWAWGPTAVCRRVGRLVDRLDKLEAVEREANEWVGNCGTDEAPPAMVAALDAAAS